MKPLLTTFAVTLLLGAITGWATLSRGKQVPAAVAPGSREAPVSPVKERPLATVSGLLKVSREVTEKNSRDVIPHAEVVAGWTTGEIRAALEECLTNKDFLLDEKGARSIAIALLAEWLKRDCDAASAWFLSIENATIKSRMILAVSHAWPPEQAEKGLSFLIGHPEVFNGSAGWSIIVKTMEKRAGEGPHAVVDLLRELREAKLGIDFSNAVSFPKSFDFPTLMNDPEVTALVEKKEGGILASAWHERDREGAFQWLLETQGAKSLVSLASSPHGESPENIQWLGSKYAALDERQRAEFRNEIEPGYGWVGKGMAEFAAGVGDPALADELWGTGAQLVFGGRTSDAIPMLQEIRDPEKRLVMLESVTPRGYLAEHPEGRSFTRADEELLRKSLAGWNATEARIESIISKFKP